LITQAGIGFAPALLITFVVAAPLSLAISIPALRLKGDYLVLATLGFQIIVFSILYNWVAVTKGPYGIPDIPVPSICGFQIDSLLKFFLLSLLIGLACCLLLRMLGKSAFGRTLKAIREDEMAALALGKNITKFKVMAFAIAASFATVSGVLFAGYMRYIDPTSFTLVESIFILSIVIIGGTGNTIGPVIGTVLMILLPEMLRFIHIPDSIAANMRQIIYGLLIVVIMRFRPNGICGEYRLQ
jgi:branched-chain amino acid transport system permease protein